MNLLRDFFLIVEGCVLVYLYLSAIYLVIFAFLGLFRTRKPHLPSDPIRKVLILIPAFKEDKVILEVVEDALKQDYPAESYHIVVINDRMRESTRAKLMLFPIEILDVDFSSSTKAKALNAACNHVKGEFDVVVILDADNLMERDFLTKLNQGFSQGFQVVQGHRVAKNIDTSFALLDGISEEINNHIFRQGHRTAGLSSALIGSAMGFDYPLFKRLMHRIEAIGGFDKELELTLAKESVKIEYITDAYVFDEKVQTVSKFTNQRRRWLAAQFYYFGRDILPSIKLLLTKGNFEYFNKSFQFILPPRILLLGSVVLINILVHITAFGSALAWGYLLLLTFFIFLFSVPQKFYTFKSLKAIFVLPIGYFWMFVSLIRSKNANREFIHTEHDNHSPLKSGKQ